MPIVRHFAAWLLLSASIAAPALAGPDTAAMALAAQLPAWAEAASTAIDAKDYPKALNLIKAGIATPAWVTLPPAIRVAFLEAGAECAFITGDKDLAHRLARDATKFDEALDWAWLTR